MRPTPTDVSGLTSGVVAMAAGDYHSCALTNTGAVKCWGQNNLGQLGDGTIVSRLTPTSVVGLSDVIAIAAGDSHTCAIDTSGAVKCWGYNNVGQLGDNYSTVRSVPTARTDLGSSLTVNSSGYYNNCARSSDGSLKCWGYFSGNLMYTAAPTERAFVTVTSIASGVDTVSAGGSHACALTTGGVVKCWGYNIFGELGDGTTITKSAPTDVSGLAAGALQVAAGNSHSCALTSANGIKCWGYNSTGQLGDNSTTQRLTAVDVSGLTSGVAAIASGPNFTCALTSGAGAKCWGYNGNGQLGDNSTTQRLTAVDVTGLTSGVAAIAPGSSHTCALTTGGGVKCWGQNSSGQLGDNSTTQRLTAVDVTGLTSGVAAIALGSSHTCALTTGGGVKCWGQNSSGQLGDASTTQRLTAVDVTGLTSGVIGISAGAAHSCALLSGGSLKCWGDNFYAQLGVSVPNGYSVLDVFGLSSMPIMNHWIFSIP